MGHARAARRGRRRRLVPGGPQALGEGGDRRLRAARRPRRRDRRQPAEVQGRRAVRRLRRQGRPVHLDLQRVRHPAAVPRRRPRLHDRHRRRAPGHHPPRREDDLGRLGGDRAEALGDRPQGLRRRPLRDGRAGVRARRLHRAADREDRRDGPERRGQRGLLQPARGDRGRGRAGGEARRADGGVRRGRRPAAPRVRARDRRGRPARGPARRAGPPLRARRRAAAPAGRSSATGSRPPRIGAMGDGKLLWEPPAERLRERRAWRG